METIDEIEARILGEIEEAGQTVVDLMLNTIIRPTGLAGELRNFVQALGNLVDKGLVRMSFHSGRPEKLRPLSIEESHRVVSAIGSQLDFDKRDRHWKPNRDPVPYILITSEGRVKASEILNERGFEWYIPERRDRLPRGD